MRAVVSKRIAGLGACLISLFSAWYFARRTNRCLLIDWRNSMYLADASENLFDLLFENRSSIADVPIVTGHQVSTFPFEAPFYPAGWNQQNIHVIPERYMRNDILDAAYPEIQSSRALQYDLAHRGDDVEAPTVVFHHGLRDGPTDKDRSFSRFPPRDVVEEFVEHLIETAAVSNLVEDFAAEHFGQRRVVGLHVRHGNGELSTIDGRLGNEPEDLLDHCEAALDQLKQVNSLPFSLFLCTDSIDVQEYFRERLSNVITFPKSLPARGEGAMHTGKPKADLAVIALAEMLLLSRCDALIHTDSQFTFFPLFKTRFSWSGSLDHLMHNNG